MTFLFFSDFALQVQDHHLLLFCQLVQTLLLLVEILSLIGEILLQAVDLVVHLHDFVVELLYVLKMGNLDIPNFSILCPSSLNCLVLDSFRRCAMDIFDCMLVALNLFPELFNLRLLLCHLR